jgi:isoquinoline 1-oxidoreductase alpha subunit
MKLSINGKETEYDGEAERPLLWYIREDLKLTGTK